eukprot:snap_masked-scaffold_82-processed-gene-0.29-mRNA-1 protein AED:1.00 eAED:1.00 QI:0/0/0/0/1/1/2/0/78
MTSTSRTRRVIIAFDREPNVRLKDIVLQKLFAVEYLAIYRSFLIGSGDWLRSDRKVNFGRDNGTCRTSFNTGRYVNAQ